MAKGELRAPRPRPLPEQNSRTALTLDDGRPSSVWPQWLAAIVATLGALSVGTCLGWMSPVLPLLLDKNTHFLVSEDEASWIGSLLTLGAALGAAPAGLLAAGAGPRRAVVLLGLPLLASWTLIAFSASVAEVLATGAGAVLSDRAGRRPLLLLSAFVMTLCLSALGCCYWWPQALPGWLPLLAIALFLVVFSLGFGPVPWLMMGELLMPEVKASASALAVTLNWLLAFGVTKAFSSLVRLLGNGGTFFTFAGVCGVGALFVLLLVPETKGKDPSVIQAELARLGRSRRNSRQRAHSLPREEPKPL